MAYLRLPTGRVVEMILWDAMRLEETGGGKRLSPEEAAEHELMLREIEDTGESLERATAPVPVATSRSKRTPRNPTRKAL
jgi:hypothetical protein